MQSGASDAALVLALALDSGSSLSYSFHDEVARHAGDHFTVEAPGLGRLIGNQLDDQIVPSFQRADVVLALWTTADPVWVAFQVGLAHGLGKRVIDVAYNEQDRASALGAPVGVELWNEVFPDLVPRLHRTAAMRAPRLRAFHPDLSCFVCPREAAADREVKDALDGALHDRKYVRLSTKGSPVPASGDVLWVMTPYSLDAQTGEWDNLRPNLGCAYDSGSQYGTALRNGTHPTLRIARFGLVRPITPLEHLVVADAAAVDQLLLALGATKRALVIRLSKLRLTNVKCFTKLNVPLSTECDLGGAWTCVAGVNGAGKSTILQAISLGLLGRRRALELGLGRLSRMIRRSGPQRSATRAEIRLTVTTGATERELVLPLSDKGPDESRFASLADQAGMDQLWEELTGYLVVAYGATRNISDSPSSQISMSPLAHRQLTLFDPLAQIVSAEALTVGGERFRAPLTTLARMLTSILDEPDAPFTCRVNDNHELEFERSGTRLEALDLPDGFRSIVALLADIALGWHELHPEQTSAKLDEVTGIVLVDELDLHLHASLQRQVVPRLRAALPNVQWVISTHSPLVAASFARQELVVLDAREPDGIRELDREVMTFTADELYDYLLDTKPMSATGVEQLEADSGTALLYQTPDRDAKQAQKLLDRQDELLDKLSRMKA